MTNTPITTAVILAAGVGRRLNSLGVAMPKGFLRVGGRPIVEESIERLLDSGIQRIVVVTGHNAEYYDRLQAHYPQMLVTAHNPRYADSGSMASLACARQFVPDDFLLLESDLVFERRAIRECLAFGQPNVVLLSGLSGASDAVFVQTRDGQLVAMSKNRRKLGPTVTGELVGISKISRSLFAAMLAAADQRFETSLRMDYETDALVAAARAMPIHCHVVDDLCWCEIDDESHLQRALTLVYPKILERSNANP
jgi:2-aminoethylphosphonate-pyruvate transaminase